jgi:transcriptional regulator with XRE-family HTH domain
MPKLVKLPAPPSGQIKSLQDLGRIIRHVRMRAGLTVDDAAQAIGIAKATLLRAEQGKGGLQFDNLLKILGGLGLSLSVLPTSQSADRDLVWPKD